MPAQPPQCLTCRRRVALTRGCCQVCYTRHRRAVVRDLRRLVSACTQVGDIDATRRFGREEARWRTENPTDDPIRRDLSSSNRR